MQGPLAGPRLVLRLKLPCVYAQLKPASVAQSDAHPTGDQKDARLIPARSGNILLWKLIMK